MAMGKEESSWKEAASAAMDRYACGEDAAFSELYDLLAPRLSAFLLRRTRDASHTEDLVQQTFLQMHHARRHFGTGADVTPWAYAIARRLVIDAFRKNGRETVCASEDIDEEREGMAPSASPEAIVGRQQLTRRVEQELARVPEAQRVAFELAAQPREAGLPEPSDCVVACARLLMESEDVQAVGRDRRGAIGDESWCGPAHV